MQWCRMNKTTVNIKKTEAMMVQSRKFIGPLLPVEITDKVVDHKEECKLLGLFIDRQLKWKTQIEKIRRKYTTYNILLLGMRINCIRQWKRCFGTNGVTLDHCYSRVILEHGCRTR